MSSDAGTFASTVRGPRLDSPGGTNLPEPRTRRALALPLVLTAVFLALGFFSRARTNPHLAWTFGGVGAFLLAWQLVLLLVSARRGLRLEWEFVAVKSHYVQAMVQLAIYVYWGWYWRNVYAQAPLILSQVAFFYAFDALLAWSRGLKWRTGFGPMPIVLGTNLFMWFRDDWFVFQFLMVATGIFGKQFIRWRREGKLTHIFNPSALALTIFSLVLIVSGNTDHTWGQEIAITQGRPPHMYMEVFLCGMVVQYFFAVTLLTFAAAVTVGLLSVAYTQATGVYLFIDTNIPIAVFLGLHLLMTDPATTPRSSVGRIIFGSLYGIGVFVTLFILDAVGAAAFYDKLVVVPFLNLLTPALDRLASFGTAGKFGRWEAATAPRKMNFIFMGGWATCFLVMLATGFIEAPHPGATLAFWKKAAEEKRPHAKRNLLIILNDLATRDLDDPSVPVTTTGGNGQSREQALGVLCNQVALIYAEGKLTPPEPAKAAHFFARSSELGNLDGAANLCIQYLLLNRAEAGPGAGQALALLEKSCEGGTNGRNCFLLGYGYDTGRGLPADKVKARRFFEQGAEFGEILACKNLGRMQFLGEGGPADHASAARWLQKAADAHDGPSSFYLAKLYHNGDGVPQDEQRAAALLKQACDLGVQPACLLLQQERR